MPVGFFIHSLLLSSKTKAKKLLSAMEGSFFVLCVKFTWSKLMTMHANFIVTFFTIRTLKNYMISNFFLI